MRNTEQLKKWIPEIYLMASVVYYWVMTGTLLNPIAITLLLILTILIILKTHVLGVTISILFLVLNCYMVLALLSELMQFPAFNKDAQIMLFFGSTYLGLNIFISTIMLKKWKREISLSSPIRNAATI